MALQNVLQTRIVDHNNEGELLNVALLTLANAATAANEPMRKQEFDAAIAALSFDNVVESTETSLADYVTANGTGVAEGTLIYLPNAPERANRYVRRDPLESDVGTVDDFININAASNFLREDLTAQYSGSDGIFIDDVNGFIGINDGTITEAKLNSVLANSLAKKGDAVTYTDLGLAEDAIQALQAADVTHSQTVEYSVVWVDQGGGLHTATIDTSADFGTHKVQVRLLKDNGDVDGFLEHISTANIQVESNDSAVRLTTDSGTVVASTLVAQVTGTPV